MPDSFPGLDVLLLTIQSPPVFTLTMGRLLRAGVLCLANLLLPVAIFVFATGFFPYKPFVPGLATFQTTSYGDHVPAAPFDKLIFMVVDALRRNVKRSVHRNLTNSSQ